MRESSKAYAAIETERIDGNSTYVSVRYCQMWEIIRYTHLLALFNISYTITWISEDTYNWFINLC